MYICYIYITAYTYYILHYAPVHGNSQVGVWGRAYTTGHLVFVKTGI